MEQIVKKNAFLNGILDETAYMAQPPVSSTLLALIMFVISRRLHMDSSRHLMHRFNASGHLCYSLASSSAMLAILCLSIA